MTLLDTDVKGAITFAERLRSLIENSSIYYDEQQIKITVSLGVAVYEESFEKHEQWIEAADSALYVSKEGGRNRVTVYSEDMASE